MKVFDRTAELPAVARIEDDHKTCHAGSDGECYWPECPQTRDGEPKATGRDCPFWAALAAFDEMEGS